jgi:hypothetical protein
MTKFAVVAAAGAASLALGGCVIVDADVSDAGWDHDFGYVLGAEVSPRGPDISITAHSNGCTNKEDFRPVVRERDHDRFDVGFRRTREDNCRALMPEGRTMTWSFAELGIPRDARVIILNPVGR